MTPPPLGISARCFCTNVIDGDTLDIELRIPLRIRLLDCWAPESRTKNLDEKKDGIASKESLRRLAQGKHGHVFVPTMNALSVGDVLTLGRVLGRVWIDGRDKDVSQQQVESGHAASAKGKELGT